MNLTRTTALTYTALCLPLLLWSLSLQAESQKPVNKLLYMYKFFYLPFSVEFDVNRTKNDILPFFPEKYPNPGRLLLADELRVLDKQWNKLRGPWSKRALLEKTYVPLNQSVRITRRLISHRVSLSRTALDRIPINEQIQLKEAMKKKSSGLQATVKQMLFLKSFLKPEDFKKFNFFLVGASWCNSSREYRVLFESYVKKFSDAGYNFHSMIIDDPKEKVFDSKLLKELFPHKKRYSHDSIPRFLAIQIKDGKTKVWEEGEALKEFYNKFFVKHVGYLNGKTSLFKDFKPVPNKKSVKVDPYLSSVR